MGFNIRKFFAACAAGLLLCSVAACGGSGGGGGGGGGGGDTPATPTAVFGGAATAGDIFVLKLDTPSTGKATLTRSNTDGSLIGTKEMTYTASGHTYTFTDSDSNQFTGLIVPDVLFAMQVPSKTESDIIIAVLVDSTVTTVQDLAFLKDRDYLLTQFRHDEKGVRWVWSRVGADGNINGHHADTIDDVDTTLDFPGGMNLDSFVYRPETTAFVLTVDDETWTLYYTKAGLGVIDRGPQRGIRINELKGTTKTPPAGMAAGDVYNTIFYGRRSETEEGTSVGTVTITEVGADYFVVTIDPGKGADKIQTGVRVEAVASDLWRGFYRIPGQDAVVQTIGSDAFVFSAKRGVWQYDYGVGVK
jgi:hypothetical protein